MVNKQSQQQNNQQQQISDAETIDMLRKMLEVSREKNQRRYRHMKRNHRDRYRN